MSNIFEKAAEVLMEGGHCKGIGYDDQGRHCAIGALNAAAEIMPQDVGVIASAIVEAASLAARKYGLDDPEVIPGPGALHPLARWNDMPERTAEDVILLFKELAHDS